MLHTSVHYLLIISVCALKYHNLCIRILLFSFVCPVVSEWFEFSYRIDKYFLLMDISVFVISGALISLALKSFLSHPFSIIAIAYLRSETSLALVSIENLSVDGYRSSPLVQIINKTSRTIISNKHIHKDEGFFLFTSKCAIAIFLLNEHVPLIKVQKISITPLLTSANNRL